MKSSWRVAAAMVVLVGSASAGATNPAPPTLSDLHREIDMSEPVLSPNGDWVAYTIEIHNLDKDISQSLIWLVGYDGKGKCQFSPAGEASESHPRWTPDGSQLVFLSDAGGGDDEGDEQIWVRPVAGGKARQVTHIPGGVNDFDLSPDGTRLAIIATEPRDPVAQGKTEPPFVTERFTFMDDELGFLDSHRRHLYLATLADGKPEALTQGPHDEWKPSWSPDGKLIAFASERGEDSDRHYNSFVFTVEARKGGVEHQITTTPGADDDVASESRLSWSPDGKFLAYLQGGDEKYMQYAPQQLAVIDLATHTARQPALIDRNFNNPKWSADGKSIYALIEQPEETHVSRIDVETGRIETLTSGRRYDADFDVGAKGRVIVLGNGELAPAEIFAAENGDLRPLSRMNDAWVAGLVLQPAEDFTARSKDGTEIHGMLIKPHGYRQGKPVPALLDLHGGPVSEFNHEFSFDWQYFAAKGYAVIAVNPRGSSGRGLDFARAIYADWGHVDVEDVLAGVDHVVAAGIADPNRLVLGGWSYGGILTDSVISQDTRFKAAISGAGSGNMLGMYGIDEYARDYDLELGPPWRNPDLWFKASAPFLHADRIRTPTLFVCAGDDMNVPCPGAYQMYQALRSLNVPTRLIRFPNQHHSPTIPSYLEFLLKSDVEWYDRFLHAS